MPESFRLYTISGSLASSISQKRRLTSSDAPISCLLSFSSMTSSSPLICLVGTSTSPPSALTSAILVPLHDAAQPSFKPMPVIRLKHSKRFLRTVAYTRNLAKRPCTLKQSTDFAILPCALHEKVG